MTHLAVLHDGILDEYHDLPLILLRYRIVVLITRPDGKLPSVRTKGECGDTGGVFRVELHPLLGGVVPDGDESV